MLKLGKGLKKKKKNKKGKKDQELFTEEELEKYRQEHSHKPDESAGTSEEAPKGNEEFEKFKFLTAGVDDILKKSQSDLDRIKKESFFQRKPTPSELKAQEDLERAEREKSEGNWVGFEEGKGPADEHETLEVPHFDEESESEYEDNDDIFDTAYVDALESGEVKLAYVPDDDELGFNDGPDPFDTSTADEVLRKVDEEERKKKKEISLGLAISVLTGRAERDKALVEESVAETQGVKRPKPRPRKIQDFCLLGSFDDSNKSELGTASTESVLSFEPIAPKSLLDEELAVEGDLPEGETLISEVLVKQVARPPSPEFEVPQEAEENLRDIVTEFELGAPLFDPEIKKLEEEEEFDEFSALAVSSVINQKLEQELQQFEATEDDPFDTTGADVVLRTEPDHFESIEGQSRHLPLEIPQAPATPWSAFDETPQEVDPFDTDFVDQCVPGKAELKQLEKEILETSIPPIVAKKIDIHLEARILSRNNSDDFNPRAGEERGKNQRVSIHITNPSGETQRGSESEEIVALSLSHRDLLGGSTTDLASLGDQPLPPDTNSPSEEITNYSDPFDTSVAEQVAAPGRAELKYIETELLSDIRDNLSDEDFDPRGEPRGVTFDIPSPLSADLLASVKEEAGARPLTPYYADPVSAESDIDLEVEDPFDTSHVTSLPGKQELKLIEQELEQAPVQPVVFQPIHEKLGVAQEIVEGSLKHSLSDQDFNPRAEDSHLEVAQPVPTRRFSDISGLHQPPQSLPLRKTISEDKPDLLAVEEELAEKALTPSKEEDISTYIDPFDTTIAENIAPGKAELKLLETELVGSISRSYSDQDFNPREPPEPRLKAVLSTQPILPVEVTEEEPEEIDPFDTSFASNLAPGKAELRLLESELVGQ